jgi:hypothetical protein
MKTNSKKTVLYERRPSPEGIIVLQRTTDKKRRFRRFRGVQKLIRLATDHHARAAEIYTNGVRNFAERSELSSQKKKDGLLKDLLKNSGKAARKTFRAQSKLPRRFLNGFSKIDFLR